MNGRTRRSGLNRWILAFWERVSSAADLVAAPCAQRPLIGLLTGLNRVFILQANRRTTRDIYIRIKVVPYHATV
jgi:hypothetical protein